MLPRPAPAAGSSYQALQHRAGRLASTSGEKVPRACVFDVNATFLDMSALDINFKDLFGNQDVRTMWFGQVIQSALVATVTDSYTPFSEVSAAALEMTAARLGISLSADGRDSILGAMRTLPVHTEVAESLTLLGRSGIRLAALTNSTEEVAVAQLKNAGIAQYFSRILSADSARRLKRSAALYRLAANELGVGIAQVRMVAAHAWDILPKQRSLRLRATPPGFRELVGRPGAPAISRALGRR